MLTHKDMVVGRLFKLTRLVSKEHQDHWFKYPKGLLVRLDGVHYEDAYDMPVVDTEDGPMHIITNERTEISYGFDLPFDGMHDSFDIEDLEPATDDELLDTPQIRAKIIPFRY